MKHRPSSGPPSLRAQAAAALAGPDAAPSPWAADLSSSVAAVRCLAEAAGLSVLDVDALDRGLLRDATVAELPVVQRVQQLLRCVAMASAAVRHQLKLRVAAVAAVVAALERDHGPDLAQAIREADVRALGVVAAVREWRALLRHPQPFNVGGRNVLLRLRDEYAMGTPLAVAGQRLAAVARYAGYYYASPLDAASCGAGSVPEEWADVGREPGVQQELSRALLAAAHRGRYVLTVRLPRLPRIDGGAVGEVAVYHAPWKHALRRAYATALHHAARDVRGSTGGRFLGDVAQLVTFSTRTLHVGYYRRWVQWAARRRQRRAEAVAYAAECHRRRVAGYYGAWKLWARRRVEELLRWRPLLVRVEEGVLRSAVQRWFMFRACRRIARSMRRQLSLAYYRALLYRVVQKRQAAAAADAPHPTLRYLALLRTDGEAPLLQELAAMQAPAVCL